MCKIFSEVRKKSWEDKDFAQAKLKEMLKGAKKFWNDPERRNKRIEDMTGYKNPNSKAVKNIETQKIFSTIKEAAEWCKMNSVSGIGQCCNKQRRTCGLHPIDKYPLHWCYANEDIKVEDIEKDRGKHSNTLKVKCLNNNKIFDNANLAAQWCGLKDGTSIRKCCLNKQKTAGIDPETLQRCEWAYLKGDDLE